MERSRKIFLKISSAAVKVIASSTNHTNHKDTCGNQHDRFQLEAELRRISIVCESIAGLFGKSALPYRGELVGPQAWLSTNEPQQCLETLVQMERLLQKDASTRTSPLLQFDPDTVSTGTGDEIKEAAEYFSSRKGYFHFLLSTEIWPGPSMASQWQSTMIDDEQTKKEYAGKLNEIVRWLDGLNCAEKRDDTLSLRQPDTCKWLFDTSQYKSWMDRGISFLWLRGKPGAGKSVLASSVIDSLETNEGEILAFFYCDFRNERSTSTAEVLRSILSQLLRKLDGKTPNIRSLLEDLDNARYRGGSTRKNARQLAGFICRVAELWNEKPLVVIDALDECKDIEILVQALMVCKNHLRLFVTSQPLHVIVENLSGLPFISMDDMERELSADIQLHVTRELDARPLLRELCPELKKEIHSVLCEKAFRWIQCSLDTVAQCIHIAGIRQALGRFPQGLDEMYKRILHAVVKEGREGQLARRVITWLVAAVRPLRMYELMEGLSIDLSTRTLDPDFGPMHRGAVLDACGSLVTYTETTGIIMLCHPSVKEYLADAGNRCELLEYHFDIAHSHLQSALTCLCYLTICLNSSPLSDGSATVASDASPVPGDHLQAQSQPLRDYALDNAIDHFQYLGSLFEFVLEDIGVLANAIQQHSKTWNILCKSTRRTVGPTTPSWPTSEHDLAFYMLVAYAPDSLLDQHPPRNALQHKEGTNPLVYAAYFNKEEHARILLSRGVRLNYKGWDIIGFQVSRVTPIEVAVRSRHLPLVTLFLEEGGTVPAHIFTTSFFRIHQLRIPFSLATVLLQSDAFAEVANNPLGDAISRPVDIFSYVLETGASDEENATALLRRFIQVVDNDLAHDVQGNMELLHLAIKKKWYTFARFLLSLGASLPAELLVRCNGSDSWKEMIRFLVENGANMYGHTATGDTVLHTVLELSCNEGLVLETAKVLSSHGCDLREPGSLGKSLLHMAVERGFFSVTQYLLSDVPDISPSADLVHVALGLKDKRISALMTEYLLKNLDCQNHTSKGVTTRVCATASRDTGPVLHAALQTLQKEEDAFQIAKLLVDNGCSIQATNSFGETPLHIAVKRSFVSVARLLLPDDTTTSPSPDLLHTALKSPNEEERTSMVVYLLKNGADAHALSTNGDPVLHTALKSSSGEEYALKISKVLLHWGCNPLQASLSGKTVLHIAIECGFVSVARYFLFLGVSPSSDLLLTTLKLCWPYEGKQLEMLRCLLQNEVGHSDAHTSRTNEDPLPHIALKVFMEEDHALEALRLLVCHGCNLLESNSRGETLLHVAVDQGRVSLVGFILSLGAQSNVLSDLLWVALRSKLFRRKSRMIDFLIGQGANVLARAQNGDSVLHAAVSAIEDDDEVLQVVGLLLRRGCNPVTIMMPNNSGDTPFHIAVQQGRISIVKLFLSQDVQLPPDILFTVIRSSSALRSDVSLEMIKAVVTPTSRSLAPSRYATGRTPLPAGGAVNFQRHVDLTDQLRLLRVSDRYPNHPKAGSGEEVISPREVRDVLVNRSQATPFY